MIKDLNEFRLECLSNEYPIMEDDSLEYLTSNIKPGSNILELGTCVGYSSIYLSSHINNVKITTIERDEERYNLAKANTHGYPINCIFADALEVELDDTYDVIIFDAAKAQNEKFLKKYLPLLKPGGVIYVDNIFFHGLVDDLESIKHRKNLHKMVSKMKAFVDKMVDDTDYETKVHNIGDGLLEIRLKI